MLREILDGGKAALGGWCVVPGSFTAEVMARAGFDWICIDIQHGLMGQQDMVGMLQGVAATAVPSMVRVPWNDPGWIMKALDAGAAGVIVPMVHREWLRTRIVDYGPSARAYHTQGAFLSATDYTAAVRVGEVVRHRLEQALAVVDVLATPVVPVVTAEDARASKSRPHTGGTAIFTAPFNLTGHPAISVPGGMSAAGIPIGLQLAGRLGGDADLLAIACAYQQATPWHTMRPPLDAAG